MKSTVDWFSEQVFNLFNSFQQGIITINDFRVRMVNIEEQAKEIEKQQILEIQEDCYILVQWPESQELMEEEWFDEEAILALGSEHITCSSAYFIPIKRINS